MGNPLSGATVLITGGTGFLGSHLTRRLVASGVRTHLALRARSSFDRLKDLRPVPLFTHIDLDRQASLDDCVRSIRPDVVFHLAGVTSGRRPAKRGEAADDLTRSYEVNVMGTLRLFQAVAREAPAARVIRAGSLAEYGVGPVPSREDQREQPVSVCGSSQLAGTQLGESFARQLGLAVTTLRLAKIYGPGQSDTLLIPGLILACLDRRPFEMTSGTQTRDYLYVDDVVDALVQAAVAPKLAGQVLNAGSGQEYRIADVAALIVKLVGGFPEVRMGRLPGGTELPRQFCDPSRGQSLLGWEARTTMEDGLAQTIAWYRNKRAS